MNPFIEDLFIEEVDQFEENHNNDINNEFLSYLEKKFGGNKNLALKEANNDHYNAVVKLAEQVSKLYEIKVKQTMQKISKFILLLLKGNLTINEFNERVLNSVGRSANSLEGIISDDTGIAPIGTRINSTESIYNMLICSCNYLQDNSETPKKAKALLLSHKKLILEKIEEFVKSGNKNTEINEFSYEKHIKNINNFL